MKTASLHKQRFGRLTVYHKLSFSDIGGNTLWLCGCDCGNTTIGRTAYLNAGRKKSCGCNIARPRGDENPNCKPKIKVECSNPNCKGTKLIRPSWAIYNDYFCDNACKGAWQAEILVGEKNPGWSRLKVKCVVCGESIYRKKSQTKKHKDYLCGKKDCLRQWLFERTVGSNNFNWAGGISCEPYCSAWFDTDFKADIKLRDGNQCQNPDCWGTGDRLTLHHIDYDKKHCHPDNLITVCSSCNARANIDREWHTSWYNAIMQRSGKTINNNQLNI